MSALRYGVTHPQKVTDSLVEGILGFSRKPFSEQTEVLYTNGVSTIASLGVGKFLDVSGRAALKVGAWTEGMGSGSGAVSLRSQIGAVGNDLGAFVPNTSDIANTTTELGTATRAAAETRPVNATRLGVERTNAADWRALRDHWDDLGYGDILSDSNRSAIARGRTPKVDEAWVSVFPEDAGLVGERISMHHIGGYPVTVPLPSNSALGCAYAGRF